MRIYQHLSNEERFYIHQAVREGKTQKEIAYRLGLSPLNDIKKTSPQYVAKCLFIYVLLGIVFCEAQKALQG